MIQLFINALVRSRLTYGSHAWRATGSEMNKLNSVYNSFLRRMVRNGFQRVNPPSMSKIGNHEDEADDNVEEDVDWRFVISNTILYKITSTKPLHEYVEQQQHNWISHVIRKENHEPTKILTLHTTQSRRRGRKSPSVLDMVIKRSQLDKGNLIRCSFNRTA